MAEETIRVGIIGVGGIAKSRHLPGLMKDKNMQLVAVANRHVENAKDAAREYGFERAVEQWQQVIEADDVDAVFICTPPYMHREMTLYALAHQKHVFCQARMAMNWEDAVPMWEADQKTNLTTMLCPPPHYMKQEQAIREEIAKGSIGEVRHVVISHPTDQFLSPDTPLHWRQRPDLQGINMLDVGITAEVLQRLFGPVGGLAAHAETYVQERPQDHDGHTKPGLPDSVNLMGKFINGPTLSALFSSSVYADSPQMWIHGTEGRIHCEAMGNSFELSNKNQTETRMIPDGEGEWTVELDFLNAVRSGKKGSPSFTEGLQYMAFTQAVMDSIASRGNYQSLRTFPK